MESKRSIFFNWEPDRRPKSRGPNSLKNGVREDMPGGYQNPLKKYAIFILKPS